MTYKIYEEATPNDVSGDRVFMLAEPEDEVTMECVEEFNMQYVGTIETERTIEQIMNGFTAVVRGENIRLRAALRLIKETVNANA